MAKSKIQKSVQSEAWPIICPRCKGNAIRQIQLGDFVEFAAKMLGFYVPPPDSDETPHVVVGCMFCDGKGTIIHV